MVMRFNMHYYAIEKETNFMKYSSDNLLLLKDRIKKDKLQLNDFIITEDVDMKYISRIVYVDEMCIYNNKDFWTVNAPYIIDTFNKHKVYDFMGKKVDLNRFKTEYNSNVSRISAIDGVAGEVDYNITIGNEFISLFREECIFTDFQEVTPLEIAQKLLTVISLVQTGSFREAKLVLKQVKPDAFLTKERLKKYEDMLDAADAITYATKEDYFYSAP
jgi:hypothetical protein